MPGKSSALFGFHDYTDVVYTGELYTVDELRQLPAGTTVLFLNDQDKDDDYSLSNRLSELTVVRVTADAILLDDGSGVPDEYPFDMFDGDESEFEGGRFVKSLQDDDYVEDDVPTIAPVVGAGLLQLAEHYAPDNYEVDFSRFRLLGIFDRSTMSAAPENGFGMYQLAKGKFDADKFADFLRERTIIQLVVDEEDVVPVKVALLVNLDDEEEHIEVYLGIDGETYGFGYEMDVEEDDEDEESDDDDEDDQDSGGDPVDLNAIILAVLLPIATLAKKACPDYGETYYNATQNSIYVVGDDGLSTRDHDKLTALAAQFSVPIDIEAESYPDDPDDEWVRVYPSGKATRYTPE